VVGYDNVRVDGHVERRINVEQATAVRRIFEMAVAGAGVKKIAKTLNAERVPSPRAQQGRPNGWAPSSVRPVLHRTLYKGVITWGKTKQRDASGERKYQRLSSSEWLEIPAPELRIVSEELWEAAHRRLKASAATYLRGTRGQLWGRPPTGLESRYLLTGLRPVRRVRERTDGAQPVAGATTLAVLRLHRVPQSGSHGVREQHLVAHGQGGRRGDRSAPRLRAPT